VEQVIEHTGLLALSVTLRSDIDNLRVNGEQQHRETATLLKLIKGAIDV
jgi:hypothetical protein